MTFLTVDRGDKVRERGCQLSKWRQTANGAKLSKQFSKFSARTPPTEGNRVRTDRGANLRTVMSAMAGFSTATELVGMLPNNAASFASVANCHENASSCACVLWYILFLP